MSKKTFMTAIIILAFLFSLVAGMQAVEVAKANPLIHSTPPQDINWVYLTTTTGISSQTVTILMPNLSHWYVNGDYVASVGDSSFKLSYGPSYWADNPFGLGANQSFPVYFEHHNETEQGQGNITLRIAVTNVLSYTLIVEYAPNDSSPIQQPTISILNPLNDSFFNVSIGGVNYQLIYETNSTLSWVGYSMDGSDNVTVTGNSTFVHEFVSSNGYHTLVVYANDTSGNWAIPQTVTYFVSFYPDYAPTPSPSPTQQPTIEPSPTPNPPENLTPILITAGLIVVAVAVVARALFYFKKRKAPN